LAEPKGIRVPFVRNYMVSDGCQHNNAFGLARLAEGLDPQLMLGASTPSLQRIPRMIVVVWLLGHRRCEVEGRRKARADSTTHAGPRTELGSLRALRATNFFGEFSAAPKNALRTDFPRYFKENRANSCACGGELSWPMSERLLT
jgi:hypothetical protein